jgi:hypothetical protein
MIEPANMPLDDSDRLYEPPLVDSLRYDEDRQAYVVQFTPTDDVSAEPKEIIALTKTAAEFHRMEILFDDIVRLMGGKVISRILHLGGGNYTIHFSDGRCTELADVSSNQTVQEVSDRLKQIADMAQLAFQISSPAHAT